MLNSKTLNFELESTVFYAPPAACLAGLARWPSAQKKIPRSAFRLPPLNPRLACLARLAPYTKPL